MNTDMICPILVLVAIIGFVIILIIGLKKRKHRRKADYARLVAWVEQRYGKISPNASYTEVQMKFQRALDESAEQNDAKMVAGLKKYVEQQKFKELIKTEEK